MATAVTKDELDMWFNAERYMNSLDHMGSKEVKCSITSLLETIAVRHPHEVDEAVKMYEDRKHGKS